MESNRNLECSHEKAGYHCRSYVVFLTALDLLLGGARSQLLSFEGRNEMGLRRFIQ